jgi:molybdate transport system substrate-binding protein
MKSGLAAFVALALSVSAADAADIKVLTAGAMKEVVLAAAPAFEQQTGHKLLVQNDTAGGLARRVNGGEAFDVVIASPAALREMAEKGKVAAGSQRIAQVGIGVAVKAGAARPRIDTVEAFKAALLNAKSVAHIDPASGGSSGIYLVQLFGKLGIADQVKAKAKLKSGGYVAELVASGEAELALHQISEIIPVKGADLIGPLPAEIQNYTVYAAAVGTASGQKDSGNAFVEVLRGPALEPILKARGMQRPVP